MSGSHPVAFENAEDFTAAIDDFIDQLRDDLESGTIDDSLTVLRIAMSGVQVAEAFDFAEAVGAEALLQILETPGTVRFPDPIARREILDDPCAEIARP